MIYLLHSSLSMAVLSTTTQLQRFDLERQTLAIMEHPAIAKVFDAGATTEGQPYFVISAVKNRGSILGIGPRAASAALALSVVLVPAVMATQSAQAQTLSVLHSFTGADGANPNAAMIRDASGNFYGTTASGGAHGLGTVFKLATTGKETVLHSFAGYPTDGFGPFATF